MKMRFEFMMGVRRSNRSLARLQQLLVREGRKGQDSIVDPNDNWCMFWIKNKHFGDRITAQNAIKIMVILAGLSACTPTFNWREVRFDQAGVTALLPCKPDRAARLVQLAGQQVSTHMAGCEAGGAMFTAALFEVPPGAAMPAVAQELKVTSKATHSKTLQHGSFLAQVAIYGQPQEGRDGPGALSSQAVETFLSNLTIAGSK